VVEAATGLVFCWCSGRLRSVETLGCGRFAVGFGAVDRLDTMTLPNPLTQSGLVAGLVFKVVAGFIPEANGVEQLTN